AKSPSPDRTARHRQPCIPPGIQCQTTAYLAPKYAYANRALHRIAAEPCPSRLPQRIGPAVAPRKTGKRRVTKESSRDGIACSLTDFKVFSQVDNLGCIEFLNCVR